MKPKMSGLKQPPAGTPLKEEEDNHEGIIQGLKRYVEQLTYEQGKALREMVTPAKATPAIMSCMKRGVAFEQTTDNWEERLSEIDSKEGDEKYRQKNLCQ